MMYYKQRMDHNVPHRIGIRRKFGKKPQVFSFTRKGTTEAELRSIGKKVLEYMDEKVGDSTDEDQATNWESEGKKYALELCEP